MYGMRPPKQKVRNPHTGRYINARGRLARTLGLVQSQRFQNLPNGLRNTILQHLGVENQRALAKVVARIPRPSYRVTQAHVEALEKAMRKTLQAAQAESTFGIERPTRVTVHPELRFEIDAGDRYNSNNESNNSTCSPRYFDVTAFIHLENPIRRVYNHETGTYVRKALNLHFDGGVKTVNGKLILEDCLDEWYNYHNRKETSGWKWGDVKQLWRRAMALYNKNPLPARIRSTNNAPANRPRSTIR